MLYTILILKRKRCQYGVLMTILGWGKIKKFYLQCMKLLIHQEQDQEELEIFLEPHIIMFY